MNPLEGVRIRDNWLKAPQLQELFRILCNGDGEAKVAGGAVRNALMGLSVSDIDLATSNVPTEVIKRVEAAGHKAIPTGMDHGTITVVIDGLTFEVTTLRRDIETDGRHAKVSFGSDWNADANRRDFTMNGLYCDQDGVVFDPVEGYGDLKAGIVRFIGEPEMRIKEDSLRILRFFRFFAHYGQSRPDAAGLKACSAQRELLEGLSAERIWMELKRLLSAKDPSRSLLWMRTTGILSIILPESEKWGIDTIPGLMRLEERQHWSADTMLRLMAMVRPETDVIKNLAKRLTLSNAERDRMLYWAVTSAPESRISDIEFGALLYRSNNQSLLDAMKLEAVRLADRDDESGLERILELIRVTDRWERPEFPIKGQDLLNIGMMPGEQVGHTLSVLETKWIKSGFKLSKEDLIRSLQH